MGKRGIKKSRPKMGRPKTSGAGQPMVVRMHDRQISAIDGWIAMQEENISRPEAIRRLVAPGLEGAMKQATRRAISRLSSADQIALAEAATNPSPPKAKLRVAKRRRAATVRK